MRNFTRQPAIGLACAVLATSVLQAQVTLSSSPNPSILGQAVKLSATAGAGSGPIAFYDGVTLLGSAPISGGSATLTTSLLAPGPHTVRARYLGSSSNQVRQTVNARPSYALKPSYFPISGMTHSMIVGDFNGDGKPDLAAFALNNGYPSTAVLVFLNDGGGGFRSAETYTLDSPLTGQQLAAADFDGDGITDLAAGGSAGVFLLHGNGDGTFRAPVLVSSLSPVYSLASGDFNGDGIPDLVSYSSYNLTVLAGNGDGSFRSIPQNITESNRVTGVADFNGDGIADLAVDYVGVLLGNGDGTFRSGRGYGTGVASIVGGVGDFNGDGKPDVVLIQSDSGAAFVVALGAGDGTFGQTVLVPGGYQLGAAVSDFNGDGKLDVACTDLIVGGVRIFSGKGDGSFTETAHYVGGGAAAIAAADWNGDGQADLAYNLYSYGARGYLLGVLTGLTSPRAALTVAINHDATVIGSGELTYTITVRNGVNADVTSGPVVMEESATGMFSIGGDGWACAGNTCTRSDPLGPGGSYPPLTAVLLRVVESLTGPLYTNTVGVFGGSSTPATAADVIELPPLRPVINNLVPSSGVPLDITLQWTAPGTTLFDIYLGTSDPTPLVATNISSLEYNPGRLSPCTTYYATVVAKSKGVNVSSGISVFRTAPELTLSEESAVFAPLGGAGSFEVTASGDCPWSVSGAPLDMVTVIPPTGHSGNATVSYSVSPYTGSGSRMGAVTVAGKSLKVLQDGYGAPTRCTTDLSGPAFVDAGAQTVSFNVTTDRACDWTVSTIQASGGWLNTVPGPTGSTADSPRVAISANTSGASRSEILVAAPFASAFLARPFTLTQRATNVIFADVPLSHPFFDAIGLLRARSITDGCASAPLRFCPDDNITRGQMAVFIVRSIMGGDNFSYSATPYFNDTPASYPFFKWIQKMWELGITNGCAPAAYCPNDPVTRGQMAVFIIRARFGATATFSYPDTALFNDTVGNPFFTWIQKMGQLGITQGCAAGQYCPNDPVTRGQMAVFIMRGAFNQLLPAPRPIIVSISPNLAARGQTVDVAIIGQNTYFTGGGPQVLAGPGITVSNISVSSATSITARFQVAPDTATGPRSITVTVPGEIEATLPSGFRVQ